MNVSQVSGMPEVLPRYGLKPGLIQICDYSLLSPINSLTELYQNVINFDIFWIWLCPKQKKCKVPGTREISTGKWKKLKQQNNSGTFYFEFIQPNLFLGSLPTAVSVITSQGKFNPQTIFRWTDSNKDKKKIHHDKALAEKSSI